VTTAGQRNQREATNYHQGEREPSQKPTYRRSTREAERSSARANSAWNTDRLEVQSHRTRNDEARAERAERPTFGNHNCTCWLSCESRQTVLQDTTTNLYHQEWRQKQERSLGFKSIRTHNDISEKSAMTPSHLETSPRNHQQHCWPRDSGSSTLLIFSDREDISCSARHVDRFSHQLDLQYPTVAARRNNLETIVPRHRRFVTGWLVRCSALSAPMFPSKRA
jgi:hypothetical protein